MQFVDGMFYKGTCWGMYEANIHILVLSSFHIKLRKNDMSDGDKIELNDAFVITNPSLEEFENTSVHSIKLTIVDPKEQTA